MLEKPNWQDADQIAIYTAQPRSLARSDREGWRNWTLHHQSTSPAPQTTRPRRLPWHHWLYDPSRVASTGTRKSAIDWRWASQCLACVLMTSLGKTVFPSFGGALLMLLISFSCLTIVPYNNWNKLKCLENLTGRRQISQPFTQRSRRV